MKLLDYYRTNGPEKAEEVAKEAGTNLANFRQIMYGGAVSRKLAKELSIASGGEVSVIDILYPEEGAA